MSTTTSRPRRKRPHPARRTRRVVGAASVGGLVVLTGAMTVAAQQDASAVSASASGAVATSRSTAHTGAAVPAAPQGTASSHSHGS